MQSEYQFAWYPRQLGLDQQRLASGDFTEVPPFLMLAVLQQWLYFGFIEAVTGFSMDWSKATGYNRDGYMVVNTSAYIDPVFHWFNWAWMKVHKDVNHPWAWVQRRRSLPASLEDVPPVPDSSPALCHSNATPILRSLPADWPHCPSFHTDARRAVAGSARSCTKESG
jgi:hypothetical protein